MDELRYADLVLELVWLALGCVVWRQRRDRSGTAWALRGCWAALFLASWLPSATLMLGLLEWQSPERPASNPGAQAMVVLGGGIWRAEPPEPGSLASESTYRRIRHGAWLYHHGWEMPVVVSGGTDRNGANLAELMGEALRQEGVPTGMIWNENRSASTHDNAGMVAQLLHPKGIRKIVLVTEAYHMPRALRLFRRAGFEPVAAPCSFRTRAFGGTWQEWIWLGPRGGQTTELAVHEMLAYGWALLLGRL